MYCILIALDMSGKPGSLLLWVSSELYGYEILRYCIVVFIDNLRWF